jgi:sugar transferase EpsL
VNINAAARELSMKRVFDLALSTISLILLSPVLLAVAAFIWLCDGRPFLFVQMRSGLHGKPFGIHKFRTMTEDRDAAGELLPDRDRLKSWGSLIRAFSLDELPQLIDIVKGDMSIVGPRPLLHSYVHRYNAHQKRRLNVKPGLTGWSQIQGRNSLSWEDRFDLDVWYVEHHSFWLDMRIICRTFRPVFNRNGILHSKELPMVEFHGDTGEGFHSSGEHKVG